jgi:hypothetical protein
MAIILDTIHSPGISESWSLSVMKYKEGIISIQLSSIANRWFNNKAVSPLMGSTE